MTKFRNQVNPLVSQTLETAALRQTVIDKPSEDTRRKFFSALHSPKKMEVLPRIQEHNDGSSSMVDFLNLEAQAQQPVYSPPGLAEPSESRACDPE